jgi:flagellar biosynthetic protein FliR
MLRELLTLNLFAFVLIFVRVGTAMMLMPGFGSIEISPTIKLAIAAAVTFVLVPVLSGVMPRIPAAPATLGILFLGEALVGAFFGAVSRTFIGALHVGGTLIANAASLTNAFVQDPIAEQQSSIVSGFLGTLGLCLVFVTNMHYLMLRSVIESYSLIAPGADIMVGDMSDLLSRHVEDAFVLGVQLSAPFLVVSLAYYVGLGLLSRLMPALPVFFIGLPLQIAVQMIIWTLGLSTMMFVFMSHYEDALIGLLEH